MARWLWVCVGKEQAISINKLGMLMQAAWGALIPFPTATHCMKWIRVSCIGFLAL